MQFELNSLPRDCSNEDIVVEIKRVDIILDKNTLTSKDFDKHGKIHSSTIKKRFGGWQEALMTAGLGHKYSGRSVSKKMRQQKSKYLTDDEVLSELIKIARLLQKNSITTEDLRNHSEIISESIVRRRFGSFPAGLEKAGLIVSEMYHRRYSDDEYFENLLNVWTYHGKQPLLRELNVAPSEISSGAYENRFGSWRKALEAFVKRMNHENGDSNEFVDKGHRESKEATIREEIKRHSILVEDKRNVSLGLRYRVLNRDRFKCVKCGANPPADTSCRLHIDHIMPFSKGGKTILDNLQTLCENCNLGKGNRF